MVLNNLFRNDQFNSWSPSLLAKGIFSLSWWRGPCIKMMSDVNVKSDRVTWYSRPWIWGVKAFSNLYSSWVQSHVCKPEQQAIFYLFLKLVLITTSKQCSASNQKSPYVKNGGGEWRIVWNVIGLRSLTFRIVQVEKIKYRDWVDQVRLLIHFISQALENLSRVRLKCQGARSIRELLFGRGGICTSGQRYIQEIVAGRGWTEDQLYRKGWGKPS